ncbi:unnamed protein product [Rhizoctonia solani]|uniref:Zn(2)-C6 fungal-type domain-containing protein n=1 Tax=Rhizoctonia solani TaxID=456999 RepID=A0A8H3DP64_9AGAM|nr:unnamed protein product [Rhizoctonia solani]
MTEPRVKKTALACDRCRQRKRKCDGRKPLCSACDEDGAECAYTANLKQRRPPQKSYVAALETRITLLEQILRSAELDDTSGSCLDTGTPQLGSDPPHQSSDTIIASPPTSITVIPPLTDDVADLLKSTLDPTSRKDTSEELELRMEGYETLLSLELEHKLLAQFWDWQRMHHPYVAPVPFLLSYAIHSELAYPGESIPSPPPPPPKFFAGTALNVPRACYVERTSDLPQFISPLLLYSMFAIAALFHGDSETSEIFYRHARRVLFEEAANPRVATIQALCLMATWELGHSRSPTAWALIGGAASLCIRLGMNVDATPLLKNGAMSQRLFEMRNFVFWSAFSAERFLAMCMGMHPLIDRHIISTPKHPTPTADILVYKDSTTYPKNTTWWSSSTLGLGDVLIQVAWDTVRDLVQMMDDLFDSVYTTSAPTRTPQDILELVTRNHLTIQKFTDDLPRWLRSIGAIKRKESGLVYIHLFIHLTSILTNRPFLSAHHASSPTTRQYRTLAFRIARASALQVSSLIRYIPLSAPCVTIPYVVYNACTILLLAPEDPAAMDGVMTGLLCLDGMDKAGYWVDSARDAARRVRALAKKWGVGLETSRRVLGLVSGSASKVQGPSMGNSDPPSTVWARPNMGTGSGTAHISPITSGTIQPVDLANTNKTDHFGVSEHTNPILESHDTTLPANIDALVSWALHEAEPTLDSTVIPEVQGQPSHLLGQQIRIPTYGPASLPTHFPYSISIQSQLLSQPTGYHPNSRSPEKHVAYATGHADPQHDMHLPHSHWHNIIPPTDPNLPFPPDPSACADLGSCFSYTVEHGQVPMFLDEVMDPYAGVAMDWVRDVRSNFPRHGSSASGLSGTVGGCFDDGYAGA